MDHYNTSPKLQINMSNGLKEEKLYDTPIFLLMDLVAWIYLLRVLFFFLLKVEEFESKPELINNSHYPLFEKVIYSKLSKFLS